MKSFTKTNFLTFLSGILVGISLTVVFLLAKEIFNNATDSRKNNFSSPSYIQGISSRSSNTEGKIDLNRATQEELETIQGIGEVKAAAIIEFRNKYGDFEKISELNYIHGIGDNLLDDLNEFVYIPE